MHYARVAVSTILVQGALAAYSIADNYTGADFFSKWSFFTEPDPTAGFVNYVDANIASQSGLTRVNDKGQAYIGVDSSTSLTVGGTGRNSVRLVSNKIYTHYLTVLDLAHMPGGVCGTWPAFWSFGSGSSGWPSQGEIDIIEGVNDQSANFMTLHTSPNCTIPPTSQSLVQPFETDCNTQVNNNDGCTFHDNSTATHGKGFNANGGGVIAAEWQSSGVKIWFWPQGKAPANALSQKPNPKGWCKPRAQWAGTGCDWDAHLLTHNLLFDTTFCGSWGDCTWGQSCQAATGAATCEQFVATQPQMFKEAYWLVNSLVVYTNEENDGTQATISGSNNISTVTPPQVPATNMTTIARRRRARNIQRSTSA